MARVEGREADGSRYVEAARAAQEAGFRQHAALAHERAARHLARIGDDPAPMLRLAIDGYRAWGAEALARRLESGGWGHQRPGLGAAQGPKTTQNP